VWGLVWIHAFIAFSLGVVIVRIICGSSSLGLFEVSPFWQKVVSFLYASFVEPPGVRLGVAVLIWIVVTFRRDDWVKLLGNEAASTGEPVRSTRNTYLKAKVLTPS
jgi:hypothetical protein